MSISRGVVYVTYGENAKQEARRSIAALKERNDLPVTVIDRQYENMTNEQASRWGKLNLNNLSKYSMTLYLDADTRVYGKLDAGFEALEAGWDMALCPSKQQGEELLWHVGWSEKEHTIGTLNYLPLQLQAGVMYVRKNARTDALFEAWRDEWQLWRDQDQAALLRALKRAPVNIWLLGHPFNGGAVIGHLFGRAKTKGAIK